MNRIYAVDNREYTMAVGAKNRNKAITYCMNEISDSALAYTDFRVKLARDKNGKPVETKYMGVLDIEEIMATEIPMWWACENCGAKDCFKYVEFDKYACMKCGNIADIPFADRED